MTVFLYYCITVLLHYCITVLLHCGVHFELSGQKDYSGLSIHFGLARDPDTLSLCHGGFKQRQGPQRSPRSFPKGTVFSAELAQNGTPPFPNPVATESMPLKETLQSSHTP